MTKQEIRKKLLADIKALEVHLKELEDSQEIGIDSDDLLDLKTRVTRLKKLISTLVLLDVNDTPRGKTVSIDDITDWFNSFDDNDEDDDTTYRHSSSSNYSNGCGTRFSSGCGSSYHSSSGGCGSGYGGRGC